MNYSGLVNVYDPLESHLGGNMREGDPYTFAPSVWDYVIRRLAVRSILDLGSGMGYSADYFHRAGCQVVAVDGLQENVDRALFPTVKVDVAQSPVTTKVDFVHCQEVVEHIEEKHIANLLASLTCGKFLLMTNATPGQGGHHHVNEQPVAYWIAKLQTMGFRLLGEDTARIRELAQKDGAHYLQHTGMLFANGFPYTKI